MLLLKLRVLPDESLWATRGLVSFCDGSFDPRHLAPCLAPISLSTHLLVLLKRTARRLGFAYRLTGGERCMEGRRQRQSKRGGRVDRVREGTLEDRDGAETDKYRQETKCPCSETVRIGGSSGQQRPAFHDSAVKCQQFTSENEIKTEKRGCSRQ